MVAIGHEDNDGKNTCERFVVLIILTTVVEGPHARSWLHRQSAADFTAGLSRLRCFQAQETGDIAIRRKTMCFKLLKYSVPHDEG